MTPQVLILACGALAREIGSITSLPALDGVTLQFLPASLHMRPKQITPAVRNRLKRDISKFDRVLIGYADCGTGGKLADLCDEFSARGKNVEMMPGAHCYQMFAGIERFNALHDDNPTTFYVTDYLVRHFERLIIDGLGIADHPELEKAYFGSYTTLLYLAQTEDPVLDGKAESAANRLGLQYDRIWTGLGELESKTLRVTVGTRT